MAKCIKRECLLRKAPVRSSQLTPPMVNYKSFLAITLVGLLSTVSSAPAKPGADISGTLELCTGLEVGVDCFDLPLTSGSSSCLAFTTTGALSHFFQSITGVVVPTGFFCMFFQSSTCTSCTQNSGPSYLREVGICQLYQGSRAWWTLPNSRSR
ncbi:hypothetical protein K438DRAFT_2013303 [Mycena galopus ATCC 62051]|nr:hypothetical protein K438DRAFT_2013303 [Mycena galopus ATCC 62051]